MENNSMANIQFSRVEMFNFWIANNRKTDSLADWVLQKINKDINKNKQDAIKKQIKNFVAYINVYLSKYNRMVVRFRTKHKKWLESCMQIKLEASDFMKESCEDRGRPRLGYDNVSPSLKRKLAAEVSANYNNNTSLLVHPEAVSAKKANLRNMEDPYGRKLKLEPVPLTPEEALDFVMENSLTKRQYMNIRLQNKIRNCDIYPTYREVIAAKDKCRPTEIYSQL